MITERHIQDLHAAISRRDWHAVEVAANRLRDASEADNAAKDAAMKRWRSECERAQSQNVELAEQLSSLEADNAELNAEKQRMLNAMSDMSNTNKKLTARIKELEHALTEKRRDRIGDSEKGGAYLCRAENAEAKAEALEAKLAAANEIAQLVIQAEEDKSGDPNFYILMMQTAYDKARAMLGGKTS